MGDYSHDTPEPIVAALTPHAVMEFSSVNAVFTAIYDARIRNQDALVVTGTHG